jgi:hypothetical protein
MKKTISYAIITILLAYPLLTLGQGSKSSLISADLGINNTLILNQNSYGNQEMPYSPKFGFSGLASYKHFINKYGYSVGLGYAGLGQKYSGDLAGTNAQRKVSLTYLKVPLNVMYNLGGKHQQTWLSFGPQVMILLSARQDFNRDGGRELPNPEFLINGNTNVINRFKPVDVMLNFEVTRLFAFWATNIPPYKPAGKLMWSASFDGAIGITDINQEAYQLENTHNVYGGSHNFYLGIKIGLMLKTKVRDEESF